MEVRIREDSVEIDGYVNAIERNSKPLMSRMGQFIERICKGAFKKALSRNDNVRLLLNHDWNRDLGGTKDGNLELTEDNIGMRAHATITDPEVVQKARNGDLVGWSFGFDDRDGGVESGIDSETNLPLRKVRDLNLYEVSILDRTKTPAYDGTLIMARAEDEKTLFKGENMVDSINYREEKENLGEQPETGGDDEIQPQQREVEAIDYSKYETLIQEMKEGQV